MQLVLHAPFGSRINKAWALALRKRFCRQFNFELQAAATEDALLLSLGPQHSFPLVGRVPLPPSGERTRHPGAGVARRAGLPDPVAMEHDDLAGRAAQPRRTQGAATAAAHAGRRPDGGRVSRRRGVPREHSRRPAGARPSAGQPDGARLPRRSDGLRRPQSRRARAHPRGELSLRRRATRRSRPPSRTKSSTRSRTRSWTMRRSRSGGHRPCRRGRAGDGRATSACSTLLRSSASATRSVPIRATPTSCHDALLTAGFLLDAEVEREIAARPLASLAGATTRPGQCGMRRSRPGSPPNGCRSCWRSTPTRSSTPPSFRLPRARPARGRARMRSSSCCGASLRSSVRRRRLARRSPGRCRGRGGRGAAGARIGRRGAARTVHSRVAHARMV